MPGRHRRVEVDVLASRLRPALLDPLVAERCLRYRPRHLTVASAPERDPARSHCAASAPIPTKGPPRDAAGHAGRVRASRIALGVLAVPPLLVDDDAEDLSDGEALRRRPARPGTGSVEPASCSSVRSATNRRTVPIRSARRASTSSSVGRASRSRGIPGVSASDPMADRADPTATGRQECRGASRRRSRIRGAGASR